MCALSCSSWLKPWEGAQTQKPVGPIAATTHQLGTWAAPSFSRGPSSLPSVGVEMGHVEGGKGQGVSLWGKVQGKAWGTRWRLDFLHLPSLSRLWQYSLTHRCRASLLYLLRTGGDPAVWHAAGGSRGPAGLLSAPGHRSHRSNLLGELPCAPHRVFFPGSLASGCALLASRSLSHIVPGWG